MVAALAGAPIDATAMEAVAVALKAVEGFFEQKRRSFEASPANALQ